MISRACFLGLCIWSFIAANECCPITNAAGQCPTSGADPSAKETLTECIASLRTACTYRFQRYEGRNGTRVFLPLLAHYFAIDPPVVPDLVAIDKSLLTLIKHGPTSIACLVEGLTNDMETRIISESTEGFLVDDDSNELEINPTNSQEARLEGNTLQALDPARMRLIKDRYYHLRVGDLCYYALGQIAGRDYQPVVSRRNEIPIIRSPVKNEALRKRLHILWAKSKPTDTLRSSLLNDFAGREALNNRSQNNKSFDHQWVTISRFQCRAAMRLLYYYPSDDVVGRVTLRLRDLDLNEEEWSGKYVAYCVRNGVVPGHFVKHVSWCESPEVKQELHRAFDRTTDPSVLSNSVGTPALKEYDTDRLLNKIISLVARMDDMYKPEFNEHLRLLRAMVKTSENFGRNLVVKYLEQKDLERSFIVCWLLDEEDVKWGIDILAGMVNDTRSNESRTYMAKELGTRKRIELQRRLCDEAARVICRKRQGLLFDPDRTYSELDEQIKTIRAVLGNSVQK